MTRFRSDSAGGITVKAPKISKRRLKQGVALAAILLVVIGLASFLNGFLSFRRDLQSVQRIRLGDSRQEVTYRYGFPPYVLGPREPTVIGGKLVGYDSPLLAVGGPESDQNTMPKSKAVKDYDEWLFNSGGFGPEGGTDLVVAFDKGGRVKEITCTAHGDNPFACWLAGRWNDDSEEEVLKLGTPTRTTITDVSKTIEYDDIGVTFTLTRGKAYSFTRNKPTKGEWALFRRYVNTLLP